MDSLQLGELSVVAKQTGVSFTFQGDERQTVTVLNNQIETLQAFLAGHTSEERRVGFRVPLRPLTNDIRSSFKVSLTHGHKSQEVLPVDLSLTGITVEIVDFKLNAGDQIVANLAFDHNVIALNANVVWQDQRLVALHFPTCVIDGELDPPDVLLSIYRAHELEWLRARVQS